MSRKSDVHKNQRIQVFARCRPINSTEKVKCSPSIVEVVPEKHKLVLKDRDSFREYIFDSVFSPDTEQSAVYKAVVEPLIYEVALGYHCTVLAYGQTGTGKTYTMEGERNNANCTWEDDSGAGIIPRAFHQLLEELNRAENVKFSMKVSFLEIYNEEVYDLLGSNFDKLRLYEDNSLKDSLKVNGLKEVVVKNNDELYAILEKGAAKRHTAETLLNAASSRSHTIFTISVLMTENTENGEKLERYGKLNLVDLAGSENVGRSGAVDKRAREAGTINQSLLTLGRVITSLIEKQAHVPYRESKLTRYLQFSLSGHAKTSIIATISPEQCNYDETVSTLEYAAKAKTININPEINRRIIRRDLIMSLTEENERLRKENEALVLLSSNGISKHHEELVRKQSAEFTSEDVCSALQILSRKQFNSLHDMVADYSKEAKQFSECFKVDQKQMNDVLSQHKIRVSSFHGTLSNELRKFMEGFIAQLEKQAAVDTQRDNDLSQNMDFMKDEFQLKCEAFINQRLPSLLNELDAQNASVDDCIDHINRSIDEKVNQQKLALEYQSTKQKKLLGILINILESFFMNHNEAIIHYKARNHLLQTFIHEIISNIRNNCDVLQQNVDHNLQFANISSFENNASQLRSSIQEPLNMLHKSLNTSEGEIAELNSVPDSIQLKEKSSSQPVTSAVMSFVKELCELNTSSCEKAESHSEAHNVTAQDNIQKNKCAANEIVEAISNEIKQEAGCFLSQTVIMDAILSHSKSTLTKSENSCSKMASQLKEVVLKEDPSEGLAKGVTPQRMYRSPRNFVETSPFHRILQPSLNTLSSPCSTKQNGGNSANTSGFLTSQDTTFGSDVFDSDSCDVASYVPNNHVRVNNKENFEKVRQPSKLPRRKSAGFNKSFRNKTFYSGQARSST